MPRRPRMTRLENLISFFSPTTALRRLEARTRLELAGEYYRSSSSDRLRNDWSVSGLTRKTPPDYELKTIRSRARDLNRNDPVASGATDTLGINVIGNGLRPQSRIRADSIGITQAKADEYQRLAERIFQDWTVNADSANRLNFDEIQALAFRKIIEDGEILAIPTWNNEPWRKLKRTVELVESDRLESMSTDYVQGIKFDAKGRPLSYSFQTVDASRDEWATGYGQFVDIPARDQNGRPNVLHVFPSKRVGQVRGVPYFAPALNYFKDMADYMEAVVVAQRISACLAIFITKNDALGAFPGTGTDDDGKTIQDIEPGIIARLNPGESINVVDPKMPGTGFGVFMEGVLRLIGVSIGMPYELLLKDFSKTNYSSARAALLEGRRHFSNWRGWFSQKFCQPIYDLVLEEAYLRGLFDVPRFYDFREEYTRAQWIGGGWGWVDPTKEVEASQMAITYGLSTLAEESQSQGRDWEEVLTQRAREQAKWKELGLPEPAQAGQKNQPNNQGADNGNPQNG